MNPYVVREIRTSNFYDRLAWLINQADGYVALSGGIGTLAEVTFAWQELLLEMISPRPLILIGDRWKRTFQAFRAQLIGPRKLYDPVTFVATPEQALYRLSEHFPHLTSASQSM